MGWIEKNVAKAVAIAVVVGLIVLLLFLRQCSAERTAKTETRLATGQAGASLANGRDAVNVAGNVQGNEIAADAITKENNDAIHKADGATAPVAPAVRDAGLVSLCRRASYRSDPKCVQHPPAH
jgi:hypothetical protein